MANACAAFSYSAALAASPPAARLVGEHERLAGRGLQLLHLAELPVQPHLQLPLVAQHRRGLVGQRLVALLLGLDRLRDLDLRVGALVDLGVGGGREVLPQLHERVGHGSSCSGAAAGPAMLVAPIVPGDRASVANAGATGPPAARVSAVTSGASPGRSGRMLSVLGELVVDLIPVPGGRRRARRGRRPSTSPAPAATR